MISCTVEDVRSAYRAFRRIGDEVRLPQKAAWRVSRLISKLKPIVVDFEETQRKLFLDAGAAAMGGLVQIEPLVRGSESDDEWVARLEKRRDTVNQLNSDIAALTKEGVSVDYDPIPLSLFKGTDNKDTAISPVDFSDAGPFIIEDAA